MDLLKKILVGCLIFGTPSVSSADQLSRGEKLRSNRELREKFGAEWIEPNPFTVKPLPPSLAEEANQTAASLPEPKIDSPKNGDKSSDTASSDTAADPAATTILNGNDIEIAALVKAISKLTKRNYVVDNSVKGKVSIHLNSSVSIGEAEKIFQSILLLKGFTTVPIGENIWKVIPAKDARQTTIPFKGKDGSGDASDAVVTQIFRLKNVQVSDIQPIISQLISKDGVVNGFAATNSLIIIDSAANIKRLTKMINELDVPALDQDITIIPILHADAKDVGDKITQILTDKDSKGGETGRSSNLSGNIQRASLAAGAPGLPGGITPPMGVNTGSNVSDKRQLPLKIIPDERTNALIVVADEMMTTKVKALVEQLDSSVNKATGRFYVYKLQHADSDDLATIITSLISGGGGGGLSTSSSLSSSRSSSSSRNSSSFGSSSSRRRGGSDFSPSDSSSGGSSSGGGAGGTRGGVSGEGKVNLEGEVSVASDPSTNSLLINASKSDYEKIKELIDLLDVKRRQVLVEATILEVSINNAEGIGIELQGSTGTDSGGVVAQTEFGGLDNLIGNPTALSDLTIAAASTGTIVLPGGITLPSQAILVTALSRNSNVNVLSTPTVLAIDNQEAEIKVGENVPFVTSTSTNQTNLDNTFNQIERQDVGIKLRITPQISAGDFVVLKIFVEISNVVASTRNDPNGPTTTIRTTETTVEVKSNQMVVTGGLISDSITESTRGVPYLKDIPFLGYFFRRDDADKRRTNLLVFITPKIISDQFVARDESKERASKLGAELERSGSPDRSEILNSKAFDNVVEQVPESTLPVTTVKVQSPLGEAVGTQTEVDGSAEAALKRTQERLKYIMQGTSMPQSGKGPAPTSAPQSTPNPQVAPQRPVASAPKTDSPQPPTGGEISVAGPSGDQPLYLKVKPKLPELKKNGK